MKVYITGEKGVLGKRCLESAIVNGIAIETLRYNGYGKYKGIDTIREGTILHCGATCDSTKMFAHIYERNVIATRNLVMHVKFNEGLRLVFTSANSILKMKTCETRRMDIYTLSKKTCEDIIEEELDRSKYTIIRLPGLYKRGICGRGFIDRLVYNSESIDSINYHHRFNNMALVEDVATFLMARCQYSGLGHIGSIATKDWMYMEEIVKALGITGKKPLREQQNDIPTSKDIETAINLGFPQRGMMELISHIFG